MTEIQSPPPHVAKSKGRSSLRRTKAAEPTPRVLRRAARAAASVTPTAAQPTVHTPAPGKLGAMVALMRRDGGASLADLMGATGWQAHSVRGALAGSLKRTRGYEIRSAKIDGTRVYSIAPEASA